MGIVLIQFIDLHFSINKPNNPLIERTDSLCGAIRSTLDTNDFCVLVFSGDIADRGKEKEYELAFNFIKKIHAEIASHIHKAPHIAITPGNHDLDFDISDFDESIREMIIEKHS